MKSDYTYFISHTRFDVVSKHVFSQVNAVSLPIDCAFLGKNDDFSVNFEQRQTNVNNMENFFSQGFSMLARGFLPSAISKQNESS